MADGRVDSKHLSPFEREVLELVLEVQRGFASSDKPVTSTVRSRVSYLLGKSREALRPSPVQGKFDLNRQFEQRLNRAYDSLIRRGLLKRRKLGGYGKQFRQHMGYKRHAARTHDLVLSKKGKALAEKWAPKHDSACLFAAELDLEIERGPFALSDGADGVRTTPCPPAEADGCL